jgi:hypothetical protein
MTTYAAPRVQPRQATVYLRRRLVVLAVLVTVIVGGLLAFSGAVGADAPIRTEMHVVGVGDTLWGLASERTPANGDVRDAMADIVDLNGLAATDLVVGQRLRLPAAP